MILSRTTITPEIASAYPHVYRSLRDRSGNQCEECGVHNVVGPGARRGGRRLVVVLYGEPTDDLAYWRCLCDQCAAAPENQQAVVETATEYARDRMIHAMRDVGEQLELAL